MYSNKSFLWLGQSELRDIQMTFISINDLYKYFKVSLQGLKQFEHSLLILSVFKSEDLQAVVNAILPDFYLLMSKIYG